MDGDDGGHGVLCSGIRSSEWICLKVKDRKLRNLKDGQSNAQTA